MKEKNRKFEILSARDQILLRPNMWIGSVNAINAERWVIGKTAEYNTISFVPGFCKIIDEILDNSIDAIVQHKDAIGTIKVDMTKDSICISDDSVGIPVIKKVLTDAEKKNLKPEEVKDIESSYLPQIAWTRLFSGSNFQDSADKTSIGSHGVGSKATAVFSNKFIGITCDGENTAKVITENNLETTKCKVTPASKASKTGTTVEFWPDLKRFKLRSISQIYLDLMYQRLLCLSITFPQIKFIFNKKRISINEKQFLKLFSPSIEIQVSKNAFIGVFPNESDDFRSFSYVNGLSLPRGGSHIEYCLNQIVGPIKDKLVRKYKNIKPADIKNKLNVVVFMKEMANLKFDSQTKETLTNGLSEISEYFNNNKIDFDKLVKSILKNDALIGPIIETFKLKEELKAKKEIKSSKREKISAEKYMASIADKKNLFVCEGLSAKSGISAIFGRQGHAYYALKGVPLNAYDASIQKISSNQELKDISNILELDLFGTENNKEITFDRIVIATDADADGNFITSQLIGWFKKFAPNLFLNAKHDNIGRIYKLYTPLVLVKERNGKIKEYFFTMPEFKEWEIKHPDHKYVIEYLKGLGSIQKEDLQAIMASAGGMEPFIKPFVLDNDAHVYIESWLGNDAEKRKSFLREYTFDINSV